MTCAGDMITHYYSGGVYQPNQTPLEILADEGVPVETGLSIRLEPHTTLNVILLKMSCPV